MGVYNGEPRASHCNNPYRSDVNILSHLGNEYIKLNAKYCYGIR